MRRFAALPLLLIANFFHLFHMLENLFLDLFDWVAGIEPHEGHKIELDNKEMFNTLKQSETFEDFEKNVERVVKNKIEETI